MGSWGFDRDWRTGTTSSGTHDAVAPDRDELERWFPLYVRFLGSILGVLLVVATILGKAGVNYAGAYVFVTGMILYKTVHDYRKPQERGEDDRDERWSHLDGPR